MPGRNKGQHPDPITLVVGQNVLKKEGAFQKVNKKEFGRVVIFVRFVIEGLYGGVFEDTGERYFNAECLL